MHKIFFQTLINAFKNYRVYFLFFSSKIGTLIKKKLSMFHFWHFKDIWINTFYWILAWSVEQWITKSGSRILVTSGSRNPSHKCNVFPLLIAHHDFSNFVHTFMKQSEPMLSYRNTWHYPTSTYSASFPYTSASQEAKKGRRNRFPTCI